MELSGFLSRDYYFKPDGKVAKLSHLRVKDNYLRFYLKIIDRSIIQEVERKIQVIHLPKRAARKPILIYEGEINYKHREEIKNYFF